VSTVESDSENSSTRAPMMVNSIVMNRMTRKNVCQTTPNFT